MPSIPSRPLELLSPFAPLANRNHSECNDFDKKRHSDSSIQSDSDDSEKSTVTNSPLSCYNSMRYAPNPTKDDAFSITQPSEHLAATNTTNGPLEPCNPELDDSSLSSDDDASLESESDLVSSNNDCDCDLDSVGAITPQQESLDKQTKEDSPKKKSVGFERFSTLYVFLDDSSGQDEDGFYDINATWYSLNELKAFRADAFLTVNWMVMKSMNPRNRKLLEELQMQNSCSSFLSQGNGSSNDTNNYYSNKFGYDRQKEIQIIAEEANYEFCERGVECRTPLGRYKKNKRRMDAMRVVMLYQQMQKQHRRELQRQERRKQQRQYNSLPRRTIQRHNSDPEVLRRIEADVDANALSNVYGAYCKDSAAEALARGQTDAIAAGMPTTNDTREDQIVIIDKEPTVEDSPSIDNEENEFMDRLISLSFCSDNNEAKDEEDSTASSVSEGSLLLEDLAQHNDNEDAEDPREVSGVVEVELVEGDFPRISYSEVPLAPPVSSNKKIQNRSWSHPNWTTTFSCNSLPSAAVQQKMVAPPTSASFSSLEMGGLFFDAATRFDWW